MAEKRDGDPFVHFLVNQHAHDATFAQHRHDLAGACRALGNKAGGTRATDVTQQAVDPGIVRLAVYKVEVEPVVLVAERGNFPVCDMRRKEKRSLAAVAHGDDVFRPDQLDIRPEAVKMRIFADDAAEVVPHPLPDIVPFKLAFFGEGERQVPVGHARKPCPRP